MDRWGGIYQRLPPRGDCPRRSCQVFIAAEIVGDSPPSRTIIQFFARELEQWRVRHGARPGAGAWLE